MSREEPAALGPGAGRQLDAGRADGLQSRDLRAQRAQLHAPSATRGRGRSLGSLLLVVATACGLGAGACAVDEPGQPRSFDNSAFELAVNNSARFGCSCLFVMKMPEAFCRSWVRQQPDVASFEVDPEGRAVSSTAVVVWTARAHYVDERIGCVLD